MHDSFRRLNYSLLTIHFNEALLYILKRSEKLSQCLLGEITLISLCSANFGIKMRRAYLLSLNSLVFLLVKVISISPF